jgi:hypothetical protein
MSRSPFMFVLTWMKMKTPQMADFVDWSPVAVHQSNAAAGI